ncbi:MAG: hypothetical protein MJ168_06960 [Clostridia bacterium]|nr:hypothetical protein [Clostridia bacterium]
MKKFLSLFLSLVFLLGFSISVYADIGSPDFDSWYVICGPDGYDFTDTIVDYEAETSKEVKDHIEPGIKLQVHSFENNEYLLIIEDDKHDTKGNGFVFVTEADLNKYFVDSNKAVSKDKGTKQVKEIKSSVSADVGVVLRQGPATSFKAYKTIPHGAKITYQYTYKYGGHNWGYTTYKGQSGWVCIDYVKEITTTTATTTTTSAVSENNDVSHSAEAVLSSTVDSFNSSDDKSTSSETQEPSSSKTEENFFANTNTVIIVCCLGAIILALVAIIIVLLIKGKKNTEIN